MRFLDFNLADPLNGVTVTADSENTEFPASNLGKHSPSRIWRSTGTFIIDSTNNKIDFRETDGGPEIIATLASGTFSEITLAAEIKARMDAATLNARTYTASQSTLTGKWTIAGSVFLELLFATGTNVASSTGPAIGFAVSDHTGATTYTGAAVALHTEEGIVFDLNTTESIDSVAVMFSPLNGIQLSNGAVLSVQANATNIWTSPAVDQTLTIDDAFFIATHFFTTDQAFRFWRIKIVDPQNANLFVELGGVVLAKATTLSQQPEKGFSFTIADQSIQMRNLFGHEYVDEYPLIKSVSISYKALQYVDVKILERMFRRNGVSTPVLAVLDEAADCFDKDHFIVWGKFQKSLTHRQENFTLFNEDLRINEIL